MDTEELLKKQEQERNSLCDEIINFPSDKKLILSGPGTGKTFIFDRIVKKRGGKCLVITFIRKLVTEIDHKIKIENTCKTFHEFAKGILHQYRGAFDLQPFLSDIIKKDSSSLGLDLDNFETKFQELDEHGPEIPFYLRRGDYYQTVSFDDAVYRLYKLAKDNQDILPKFDQIVVDEYQDFNKLEVEFIKILEQRGPILIAGDDDQALYVGRSASPEYIKELYRSKIYKTFSPKHCSRCTSVVVDAFNGFIKKAQENHYFTSRINEKRFECFLPSKIEDSKKYQKIDFVECTTASTVAKYIVSEIKQTVDTKDINDSFVEGEEYPTVLIIGPGHYLKIIYEGLIKHFSDVKFDPSEPITYSIIDAYKILINDRYSNLGWRIVAEFTLDDDSLANIVTESENNVRMIDLLSKEIVDHQNNILDIITKISVDDTFDDKYLEALKSISPENAEEIILMFKYKNEEQKEVEKAADGNQRQLSILLTSYQGAKGLSGGHVFVAGLHNKSLPKDAGHISDIEISQFLVAITRTRKKLHLISNKWFKNPMTKDGKFMSPYERSVFIDWIPDDLINNRGTIKSEDIK